MPAPGSARRASGDAGETRIGITGHSDLGASSLAIIEAALRADLTARIRGPWAGVSCLAPGTDQIFAALVLEFGGNLEVILPARDYRARKVGPDNAAVFDRLLAAASAVTVLDVDRCNREAYLAASEAMLDAVDVVLAVWDGRPARRLGSTGDVVVAARRRGLPITVLWPPGAARRPAPDAAPVDTRR
jgi:hypothetical protein